MKCEDYINLSNDKEIICLSNLDGIHFYDIINFQLLFKLNPLRIGLVGIASKCKIFYNSHIIAFIIIENLFSSSKDEQLIILSEKKDKALFYMI